MSDVPDWAQEAPAAATPTGSPAAGAIPDWAQEAPPPSGGILGAVERAAPSLTTQNPLYMMGRKYFGNNETWNPLMAALPPGAEHAAALTSKNLLQGGANLLTAIPDLAQSAWNHWGAPYVGGAGANPLPSEYVRAGLNKIPGMPQAQGPIEETGSAIEQGLTGIGANAYGLVKNASNAITAAPGATRRALEILKTRLGNDAQTWERATQEVTSANEAGIPLRLSDMGPNTRKMADMLAHKPGGSEATMVRDAEETLADTPIRVPQRVRADLGTQANAGQAGDDLERARSLNAKANYAAVRADTQPIQDPTVERLLGNPLIAKLYQDARSSHMVGRSLGATVGDTPPPLADLYGTPPTPKTGYNPMDFNAVNQSHVAFPSGAPQGAEWARNGTPPDVRSLDYLQRAMDGKISQLYNEARSPTSTSNPAAGEIATQLKAARGQLVDRMKELSPSFTKAFESYGSDSEVMDALATGRGKGEESFLNMDAKQAQRYVNGLSDSGKAALRQGVADRLLHNYEQSGRGNIAEQISRGPLKQQLVQTLFDGDDQKFDVFMQAMQQESQIYKRVTQALGNSATYGRLAAEQGFHDTTAEHVSRGASIINQWMHHWGGAAVHGVVRLMQPDTWNPGVAQQVARILSSKDPATTAEMIQRLEATAAPQGKIAKGIGYTTQFGAGQNRSADQQYLQDKYGVQP